MEKAMKRSIIAVASMAIAFTSAPLLPTFADSTGGQKPNMQTPETPKEPPLQERLETCKMKVWLIDGRIICLKNLPPSVEEHPPVTEAVGASGGPRLTLHGLLRRVPCYAPCRGAITV